MLLTDDPDPRRPAGRVRPAARLDLTVLRARRARPSRRLLAGRGRWSCTWLRLRAGRRSSPGTGCPRWAVAGAPAVLDIAASGCRGSTTPGPRAAVLIVLPGVLAGSAVRPPGALVMLVAAWCLVGAPEPALLGPDRRRTSPVAAGPAVGGLGRARASRSTLERSSAGDARRPSADRDRARRRPRHHRAPAPGLRRDPRHRRRRPGAARPTRARYQSINRRHRDFMRLAYPEGHGGRAGQLGACIDADGVTLLTREEMPTYRAAAGRGVRRLPDLGRRRPADLAGALGLGPLGARRRRARSPAPRSPTRTSPTSCGRCGSRTSSSPRSPTSCARRSPRSAATSTC